MATGGTVSGELPRMTLLRTAETWPQSREGTLVALLVLCGFRMSEALGIRALDITPRELGRKAEVRIRRKGRDHRTVFDFDDHWLAARLATLKASTRDDRPVFDLDRFRPPAPSRGSGAKRGSNQSPTPTSSGTGSARISFRLAWTPGTCSVSPGTATCAQLYVDALRRSNRPVSSLLRRVFSEIRDELDSIPQSSHRDRDTGLRAISRSSLDRAPQDSGTRVCRAARNCGAS
jgi:hypothetical protein